MTTPQTENTGVTDLTYLTDNSGLTLTAKTELRIRFPLSHIVRLTQRAMELVKHSDELLIENVNQMLFSLNCNLISIFNNLQSALPTINIPPFTHQYMGPTEESPASVLRGDDMVGRFVKAFLETNGCNFPASASEDSAIENHKWYFVYERPGYTYSKHDLLDASDISYNILNAVGYAEPCDTTVPWVYCDNAGLKLTYISRSDNWVAAFDNGRVISMTTGDILSCPEIAEHANFTLAKHLEDNFGYAGLTKHPLSEEETYISRAIVIENERRFALGKLVVTLLNCAELEIDESLYVELSETTRASITRRYEEELKVFITQRDDESNLHAQVDEVSIREVSETTGSKEFTVSVITKSEKHRSHQALGAFSMFVSEEPAELSVVPKPMKYVPNPRLNLKLPRLIEAFTKIIDIRSNTN